jgi:hypothetical protein
MSATSAAPARTGERYFISGVQTARRAAGFGGLEQLYDRHYAAFGYPADQLKRATIEGLRDRVSWQSSLDALMRAVEIDPEEMEWQRWLALVFEQVGRINDALLVRRTIASLDPHSLENNFAIGRLLECKGEPVHKYYAQVLTGSSYYLLALARGAALSGPTAIEPDSPENNFVLGRMLERKEEPVHKSDAQVPTGSSDCLLALARRAVLSGPIVSEHITQLRLKDRIRGALILSPASVALHLAMGFIGIAERDDTTTRTNFLAALMLAQQPGPKERCDPWSLAFAQAFLRDPSGHIAQLSLKDRIRGALNVTPTNVTLHLAMGFIGIAEHDEATTRTSFLTAQVLAEQPGPKEGYDPWSFVFAQAFLLDRSDMTTSSFILPLDPIRLALARAALLLSHGAIVPALREYLAAASPLLVQKLPRAYQIYNGYKIVLFKNRLYGVPKNVRDFSILRGRVINVPDVDEGSGLRLVRSRFAALLSDWQRARLKYFLRVARPHIQIAIRMLRQAFRLAIRALRQAFRLAIRALRQAFRLAIRALRRASRVPGRALRLGTRMLRRLAGGIYLRRHIVGGVLVDNNVAQLQQRIDAEKGGTGVRAGAHTSEVM